MGRIAPIAVGDQFYRLTVSEFSGVDPRGNRMWKCDCECGGTVTAKASTLIDGTRRSCGCRSRKRSMRSTDHRPSESDEYRIWKGMKHRCNNPDNIHYHFYGGKGIKVCKEWESDFSQFLSDMGHRPSKKHSIERISSDGDYEPANCKWATPKEQSRNTSQTRFLTFNNKTMCITDWGEELKDKGISRRLISNRLNLLGWSVEKALTTPARKINYPSKQ